MKKADRLDTLLAELDTEHGTVALPRFELERSYELPEELEGLGMEVAFTPDADFSGIWNGEGFWIDTVLHDASVDLDEEETEAAAGSAVAIGDVRSPDDEDPILRGPGEVSPGLRRDDDTVTQGDGERVAPDLPLETPIEHDLEPLLLSLQRSIIRVAGSNSQTLGRVFDGRSS